MKKSLYILVTVLAFSVPAFGNDRKTFTVSVDPPDAAIRVVSGNDLKEQLYRSPATITAIVPGDRELAKKAVMEISRDRCKPAIIPVRSIRNGEVLKIRLEKSVRKSLRFSLVAPTQSPDLEIKDSRITMGLRIDEQQMQLSLTNNTPNAIRVLWERAGYTDVNNQFHRIMHPGIRYQDRNHSLPSQSVMPYMTLHQQIISVDHVVYNPQKKDFEPLPLFALEKTDSLAGKTFEVVIPVAMDSQVVPYRFRVKALGMVTE